MTTKATSRYYPSGITPAELKEGQRDKTPYELSPEAMEAFEALMKEKNKGKKKKKKKNLRKNENDIMTVYGQYPSLMD